MGRALPCFAGLLAGLLACGDDASGADAGDVDAAETPDAGMDAGGADGGPGDAASPDAGPPGDAAVPEELSRLRSELLDDLGADRCATWSSFDESQRAVFLTITHRLYLSATPDGMTMLHHITALHLVLGGGADGMDCGGSENNRLFLSMDDTLWDLMVRTEAGESLVGDGGGMHWGPTRDLAGPHDPFDRSNETESGLACVILIETGDSHPPTGQVHFFSDGSAAPVERGPGISLPADPRMLEIDQDYNCVHDSNPLCGDFDERYRRNYGEPGCGWVPDGCTADGSGCYPAALSAP